MNLLTNAREIDYAHRGEKAIFQDLGAEGLVLFARDIQWGDVKERQLMSVVAGIDGPDLVCARAWPPSFGTSMITRLDLRCPVKDACRRFLFADGAPAAQSLVPHVEAGIVEAYPAGTKSLWRQGTAGEALQTIYLLRIPSVGGHDLVVASETVKDGKSTVVEHGRVSTAALLEWANETFGVQAPAP